MATIYDVADKAGYSIATVSKVINNNSNVSEVARKKVLEAIEELNYVPSSSARTLVTKRSKMIGVVLGIELDHPFFSPVLEELRAFSDMYNYDLLFVSRGIKGEKNFTDQLVRRGVDGIIVFDTDADLVDFNVYNELDIPTIFVDKEVKGFTSVYSDNYQGAEMATKHLLELGHERIGYIHGEGNGFVEKERYAGFEDEMMRSGVAIDPECVVSGGYYSVDGGRSAMMKLLCLENRPTAVFAVGDEMAIGAIQAIKESGLKVPEDISVIGFDDIELAKYSEPALTTIQQDKQKIGQMVGLLTIESILNINNLPTNNVVPVRLIKRDSTSELR